MSLLERFVERVDFDSYEDFKQNFKLKVPKDFNFGFDVVDVYADTEPEREALIWCDDNGNEKHFTFTDIKEKSNRVANMFKGLGIKKGDRVLMILRQRPEVWFTMVGLHKLGAVVIPATFQLEYHDIVYRCNAANVKMIVCADDQWIIDNVNSARPDCKTVEICSVIGEAPEGWRSLTDDIDAASPVFERPTGDEATHNEDQMIIYFSSGTTGEPKMILHDYLLPLGHIVTAKYWQQVYDGCRHLTQADSGWAKFAWGKIYGQWIAGAVNVTFDTQGKFSAQKMLEIIEKLKLNSFCGPSTIYRYLIQEDLTKYDFSSIKHCSMAGEPLNPEVFYKWKDATGLEIREGFGQTEGSVLFANFPWVDVKPGSTGKPTPLYDIQLLDDDGNPVEDGIVGNVIIKNASSHPTGLFKEYYQNPEAMADQWPGADYNTGDTAWRDPDGYIWFVGRNDDVIKCSGYRIGPFEVESALMTHPAVLECAVTSVPDPMRGQAVKATIVLTKQYQGKGTPELVKELQNHVKHATAPYKYPRVIEFVEELPKTPSGKIMRKAIKKADEEKYKQMQEKAGQQ